MIFSNKESVEDSVIRLISNGIETPFDMYEAITVEGKGVTLRAVYKAIKFLIKSSIVVKSGKKLAISQEWIDTLTNSLKNQYAIPSLIDGESATYKYKSLANLDSYWKHLTKSLREQYADYPVFLYSPYNIWLHVNDRQESQLEYYRAFKQKQRYGFYVIGNHSKLDLEFKKDLQNDFLQIDNWHKSSFKQNEYVTIVKDYVVTVKISDNLSTIVREFYNTSSEKNDNKLNAILDVPDTARVKLERNAKKAKRLRKKLFKNFYMPKKIKDKFDLF